MSGGVVWIPNNPLELAAGVDDTPEKSRTYLDACAAEVGPASSPERRQAFLTEGPRAIAFLQKYSMHFVRSEEHTSELQSLMPISYAVFSFKKQINTNTIPTSHVISLYN